MSIGGAASDDKPPIMRSDVPVHMDPAAASVAARRAAFRWWDPLLVLVIATVGCLVPLFCFGVASAVWSSLGPKASLGAESTEFFAPLAVAACFDLVVLLVMRSLAKRRGRALFASYLRQVGMRPVLYGALSGISLAGIYIVGLFALSLTSFFQNHPMLDEGIPIPQSYGQLAVFALVVIIIAPFTEELYFRGLVLDCLQKKLAPRVSAAITALLFSLCHLHFWIQPGIVGWMATAAIAGFGLLAAFWVQLTHSLRPAIAAHAGCNATITLYMFVFR